MLIKKKKILNLLLIFLLPHLAHAEPTLQENLASYFAEVTAKHPNLSLSFSLQDLNSKTNLYSHNADQQLIPASVLKLVTTYAALKKLGANHRFQTEFYAERLPTDNAGETPTEVAAKGVGSLYVRGYGDPSLVNEDLNEIVHSLYQAGVRVVDNVVVDSSLFVDPSPPSGESAYKAGLSAVSLNYNSYLISLAPSALNAPAFVELRPSAPFVLQNNVTTVMGRRNNFRIVQDPQSGAYKGSSAKQGLGGFDEIENKKISLVLRGTIGLDSEPVKEYLSVPDPAMYFAESFVQVLEERGIKVSGKAELGEVPAASKLVYLHKSKYLVEILRSLNQYSNNFIAGQLLYSLGQDSSGYFHKELALKEIYTLLESLGIRNSSYAIVDGSGLDKSNRLSAASLVTILSVVYADFEIMPDFLASLSRFSASGTLKTRQLKLIPAQEIRNRAKQRSEVLTRVWGKTGSLDGVSSLAGYLELQSGARGAYAIIINGVDSKDRAIEIENKLVEIAVSSL